MELGSFRCGLCGRRVKIQTRSDAPIFDPNTGFGVCKNCIKDLYRMIQEDEMEKYHSAKRSFADNLGELLEKNKPHVIKEYLDQFIIKQERAKKILSVAVYNHYKRMKYGLDHAGTDEEIDKSNVIILGPTGCGKTALLSHLSKLLDIPFAVTDGDLSAQMLKLPSEICTMPQGRILRKPNTELFTLMNLTKSLVSRAKIIQ